MYAIFKRELFSLLNSLMAYVTIGVFLLALGLLLWIFPDTSILDYGYAELSGFFSLAPLLFIFFISAITMRSFAEEKREGTFVLIATRPLSNWQIILGKYFACFVVLCVALIPTLIYYISIYQLSLPIGNVDTGAVIGSYAGLLLLGSVFVSIGIFSSSLTKNQIIAFAISAFLCFVVYLGFDQAGTLLIFLSVNAHYQSMSRGVLDTRDLIYFLTVILFFLSCTNIVLGTKGWIKLAGIFAFFVLLNLLAQYAPFRFDVTKEKRFTLSDKTVAMLKSENKEIHITVFLEGDLPAAFKRLQNATKDLLSDYQSYASNPIKIEFVDPIAGLTLTEQDTVINNLYSIGVEATNLNIKNDNGFAQKTIFPMAVVSMGDKQLPIKLLQNQDATGSYEENINNSIQNLEYAFSSAIKKVSAGKTPRIGFTEGNGELSDPQLDDAIKSLAESYEVGRVNLNIIDKAGLDKLKLLVIAKPQTEFTEAEKYKLDYFVKSGGRVVFSIDQVSADLDSLQGKGEQLAFNKKLNLDDLLFTYGARINYDLIADANCSEIPLAMGSGGQIQLAPWIYYPILLPDTANNLVKNIDGMRSEFISTVDTIGVRGITKKIILQTSAFNKVIATPKLLSLQMVAEQPDPKAFSSTPKSVAVLLEGTFPSVFSNRPVPSGISENYGSSESGKPAKIVVIGDGDVFKNQVSSKDGSVFPLGFDRYTQNNYGNKALLLNLADYLSNDDNLIELRSKQVKIRLLDKTKLRTEKFYWQITNIGLPLLVLILFAIFQHYYRKHKYAR
jgi:ABC-2 type transport system permease protein